MFSIQTLLSHVIKKFIVICIPIRLFGNDENRLSDMSDVGQIGKEEI